MPFLPFAGKNSIVEALLGVQFSQPIIPFIQKHLEALKSEFAQDFPKFDPMQQLSINFGGLPAGGFAQFPPTTQQPIVAGFNASLMKPDGQPSRVLRAFGDNTSSHFLEYDHWKDKKAQALNYLRRCFAIMGLPSNGIEINGVQLTFIDRFTFDGDVSGSLLSGLVKSDTRYLPHHMLPSFGTWQCNSLWQEMGGDWRTDHNLSAQGLVEKHAVIVITHNQGRSLGKMINSIDDLQDGGTLDRHFDELHTMNASILKNILSEEMLKQIGLT